MIANLPTIKIGIASTKLQKIGMCAGFNDLSPLHCDYLIALSDRG